MGKKAVHATEDQHNRNSGPLRFRGRFSPIAVDLGPSSIKLLQLEQQRGRIVVTEKQIVSLAGATLSLGPAATNGAPAALRRALQEGNWRGRRANLSLNSRYCHIKTVIMPRLKAAHLRRAMRLEAEKQLPLKLSAAVIDYCHNRTIGGNGCAADEFLLAAAAKEIADACCRTAVEADLTPLSLDAAPAALLRSLRHHRPAGVNGGTRILVDCSLAAANLLIASAGAYRYHRVLNSPAPSLKVDSSAQIDPVTAAQKLAHEITLSLEYWLSRNDREGDRPQVVEICGDALFIPGLASALQQNLPLKLILYNPLCSLEPGSGRGRQAHEGALFATAHGLALRGWVV